MLAKLSLFLKSLAVEPTNNNEVELSLEIACAVLLCEVMRADGHLDEKEQATLRTLLVDEFKIAAEDVDDIITHAIALSEHATDFHQFTSMVNQHYSAEQRVAMLRLLWKLANADGHIASIEEHIIRKIADLLHLRHSEYIQTKLEVLSP